MALCDCKIGRRKTTIIGSWDGCPLNGGHTNFRVLRCDKCKGIVGFPAFNLNIALENGTPETKKKLAEILNQ